MALDLSDPLNDPKSRYYVGSSKRESGNVRIVRVWVAVTLGALGICWTVSSPGLCREDASCQEALAAAPWMMNAGALCSMGTVLVHEAVSIALRYAAARPLEPLLPHVMDAFKPGFLVCLTIGILCLENAVFMSGLVEYVVHRDPVSSRPVDTITTSEWLINVPILVVLSGRFALGKPLQDCSVSLLVTNIYIIIAWAASFMVTPWLRWGMVMLSFLMYFYASADMTRWSMEFYRASTADTYSRYLRTSLAFSLNIAFLIYGLVYLASKIDLITYRVERISYTFMNVIVKMGFSMAFAGIRTAAQHERMVDMIVNKDVSFLRQEDAPQQFEMLNGTSIGASFGRQEHSAPHFEMPWGTTPGDMDAAFRRQEHERERESSLSWDQDGVVRRRVQPPEKQ